jgi:hypothetical protein
MMRNISISHTIRRWPIEIFPKPMISCRAVRCGRDEGICLRQDGSRSSPSQPSNGEKIVDVRRVESLKSLGTCVLLLINNLGRLFSCIRTRSTSQFSINQIVAGTMPVQVNNSRYCQCGRRASLPSSNLCSKIHLKLQFNGCRVQTPPRRVRTGQYYFLEG